MISNINKRLVDSRTIFEFKELRYGNKPKSDWHERYAKRIEQKNTLNAENITINLSK